MNTRHTVEEFERCVICGELTCIPVSLPIDWRENYEIGCGQVCAKCAKAQQKSIERNNALAYEQILQAVEQSKKQITSPIVHKAVGEVLLYLIQFSE